MRIVTEKHLTQFADENPQAQAAMENLKEKLRDMRWANLNEVRATFPHADEVEVKSGRKITVLNAGGNNWRVIAAFHYNTQIVYILKIMVHAEYSRGKWKETL